MDTARAARLDDVPRSVHVHVVEIARAAPPQADERAGVADRVALTYGGFHVGTRSEVAPDRREGRARRQRMTRKRHRLMTAPRQRAHDRRAEIAAAAGDQDPQHADMLTEMFTRQKTGSV